MTSFNQAQAQSEPSFSNISKHLYVQFSVRPFRHARVAWLNKRWFSANGVDCSIKDQRDSIEKWLVDNFGVSVPGEDDPDGQYASEERQLYADRYGAPAGTVSGGSGRVGTLGAFNAKGIGRTPLVALQTDWYHSHGCMFLEEAIREAVLSEVCAAIFPYGAVPTIAVIDTGARLRWRDGTYGARRAIIVRPTFLRIAHFMRTIFFGTSGCPESDQVADAASVRDMWRTISAEALQKAFSTAGAQYGFGNALRLWPGPFFVSNFTLNGALVDFGSFRALPNWFRAKGESRAHCFGGETTLVAAAARSLARNAFCADVSIQADDLTEQFHLGFETGFATALQQNGIEQGSSFAQELEFVRYRQQRQVVDLAGGNLEGVQIGNLRPRTNLYREVLLAETEAMIASLDEAIGSDISPIARFIDDYVAKSIDNS